MFTRLFRILWGNRDALFAAGLYVLGYAIVVVVVIFGEITLISYPVTARDIPAYQAPNFFGNANFESQVAKRFLPAMRLALFLRVVGSAYLIAWLFVRVFTAIAARRWPVLASVRARVTLLATVATIGWMAVFGTLRADVVDRYGGVIHHRGLTLSEYYDECVRMTKNPAPMSPKCAQIERDRFPTQGAPLPPTIPPTRDEAAATITRFLHDNPPVSDDLVPHGVAMAQFEHVGAVTKSGAVAAWARPFLTPSASKGFLVQFTLGTCELAGITAIDHSPHRGTMPFAVTYRERCVPNELGRKLRQAENRSQSGVARTHDTRTYLLAFGTQWAITNSNPSAPRRTLLVR